MKPLNKAGFTIIETMLFLGITGLLVMGILIGTGNSINIQRYRDSVVSLQSVLQQQYSEVANVTNDNLDNSTCGVLPRGQSDCVIMGQLITSSDGKSLLFRQIIGHIPTDQLETTDIKLINQYKIDVVPGSGISYGIDWGSTLAQQTSNANQSLKFSILVLRSPLSGVIRTFIDNSNSVAESDAVDTIKSEVQALVNLPLPSKVKMCVNSNGLFNGNRMAVLVTSNATSASGVETLGDASSEC